MKNLHRAGISRVFRVCGRTVLSGALALAAAGAQAATGIEVWHTLAPAHKAEFEKLVKQFNREQGDVRVTLKAYPDQQALRDDAARALAAKRLPNLVQIYDNHSPEVIAEHKAILPMYELLKAYPIKDLAWFLPQTSSFTRDTKGRLLAFPWMAEVPIMFYNLDLYKKAGLDPNRPAATWSDLQGELLQLRDKAGVRCPYASSQQVEVHLENLAPINNRPYALPNNGLDNGKANLSFDSLYMRHLSLMVSWKRSMLFTEHTPGDAADALFAKGQCAVLTAGSGALGEIEAAKSLNFGVAPLPYYPQVTRQPGRPFVSGSALWALDGHPKDQNRATAAFLAFLAKPVVAAQWHQRTGFLPLTEAAFRAADVSFYNRIPGAQQLIQSQRTAPGSVNRGFRIANYARIQPVLNKEFEAALSGDVPPMKALTEAADQSRAIMQQR